jgi:hypothetical protein
VKLRSSLEIGLDLLAPANFDYMKPNTLFSSLIGNKINYYIFKLPNKLYFTIFSFRLDYVLVNPSLLYIKIKSFINALFTPKTPKTKIIVKREIPMNTSALIEIS